MAQSRCSIRAGIHLANIILATTQRPTTAARHLEKGTGCRVCLGANELILGARGGALANARRVVAIVAHVAVAGSLRSIASVHAGRFLLHQWYLRNARAV